MVFKNGESEIFTLLDGESATATGLPAGIKYTVTELEADHGGYKTSATGETGSIEYNKESEAVFQNEFHQGSLTVTKELTDGGNRTRDFRFMLELPDNKTLEGKYGDMTFSGGVAYFYLKGGESKTAANLPAGAEYTVTEMRADGYNTSYDDNCQGQIQAEKTVTATITNAYDGGNLIVSKTVVGSDSDKKTPFHFTVTLSDSGVNGPRGTVAQGTTDEKLLSFKDGVASFLLKDGQSATIQGLPVGTTYEVSEEEADQGLFTTDSQGETGTIERGETKQVRFTNTHRTGALHISMTVEGRGAEKDREFHFTVTLSDTGINGPMGQFASGESQLRAEQAEDGSDAQLNFTNGVAKFTLKHGQSVIIPGLPAGTDYIVTENDANQYGYRTRSEGETGSIIANDTVYAVFVNTKGIKKEESGTQPGTETEPSTEPPAASEAPASSGTKTLQPLPDPTLALTPPINDAGEANDADTEGANVPTGDEADPFLWMALLGLSLLALAAPWAMRRKRRG